MAIQPGVWGIDLGQCALKAIRLEEVDGQLTATAFDYVEHPKILSQPDADPDQLTREALEKFLLRNNLRGDIVGISVPGQSGLARFVKLPPVEEKKISDIVRFEAKQQIPFNLEEVVWDYQKIGSGIVTDGFAMETEIGLFAMKRDMVNRYLQHFKDVGVDVHVVQMAPLALCNFVSYDLLNKGPTPTPGGEEAAGKKRSVVALDIGADSSSLVITDGERIIWQRPIPIGGNHFTRALTKDLKLTFAKAEHLKRNATKSPDLKKILSALKPVLNDFVGEVQRSLGYFSNTHRDAQIEYLVGLGNAFRLPGLQRFLGEKLQLDVRKLQKLERLGGDSVVTAPVYTENILSFGVAYGLALQGLKQARLVTNLLPGEIRMERLVKAKKPYAVAAAAALLLGLGALGFSYYLEDRTYGHPLVQKQMKETKDVTGRAGTAESTFTSKVSFAKEQEVAVKSIVAGQDERINWLTLNQFISEAIPQPNGKNLPPSATKEYWNEKPTEVPKGITALSGEDAFKSYGNRHLVAKDKDPSQKEDTSHDPLGPEIDNLVQFNIEAIDSRFCDDLGAFWNRVTSKETDVSEGFVRPKEHWSKPPTEKGWVIEIRGYTFHHKRKLFVLNTLVENIALRGIKEVPAEKEPTPGAGGSPPAPIAPPAAPAKEPLVGPPLPDDAGHMNVTSPVINRISHVVLFNAVSKPTSDRTSFEIIGTTHLPGMVAAAPAAATGTGGTPSGMPTGMGGGMPAPGGMPTGMGGGMPGGPGGAGGGGGGEAAAPTGPSRDSWTPLDGEDGGGAGASPGMNIPGLPGGKMPMTPTGSGLPVTPKPPVSGVPKPNGNGASQGPHVRTEFVIFFVWKELTPSDALRGQDDTAGGDQAKGK